MQLKENGQQNLRQSKTNKKFVYLISPNKIRDESFYTDLSHVLSSKKISFFQLRLKKEKNSNKLIIGKKIIGVTCHNSINLAKIATKAGADYLAFGAFYASKTKIVKYRASLTILKSIKKITSLPIVAIGGIKLNNYKKLLLNKANFLAISSYIWNNKKYKPLEAIKKLK